MTDEVKVDDIVDLDEKIGTVDASAEIEGKWVKVFGVPFLLARAGGSNTKYINAHAAAMRPHARSQQLGNLSEEEAREIMVEPFVKHVVLGWKPFKRGGKVWQYSRANAKALLMSDPDVFTVLMEAATNMATFRAVELEDAAKNL